MKRTAGWILALILFGAGSAFAQLYKWVDINGRTRYGDVPPPGLNSVRLKPAPPPAGAPANAAAKESAQRTPAEMEMDYRKRQADARAKQQKAEQSAALSEAKAGNCARAQEALRSLESGRRIVRVDANGERYFPDESAIEQQKAAVLKMVQENCG